MKPAPRSQRATRPAAKAYAGDRKPCEVCVATLIPVALVLAVACALGAPTQQGTPASFASRIEALSETGGHFDTDNLISNERSYLHVAPALRELRSDAGAYIGVGPDQNFSYIAHVRPSIAIIIDIRRDNLLLHLLFNRDFRFACPRWPLYTPEGRPAPETLVRHSIVPLQRPSAQPVVTCGRLEPLFSGHFSDTAPHVGHFFANRTALPVPRVSLPAPAAPRSAATCRRTAAGLDVLPPAGASSTWHTSRAGPRSSPAAAGDS